MFKYFCSSAFRAKNIALITGLTLSLLVCAADNMRMHGALVHVACDIQPGDESQTLDLGLRTDNFLYQYIRTPSRTINLNLINCDTSIGNMVNLTLAGTESSELAGFLAPDGSSVAAGIGIGIEASDGRLLPVNDVTGISVPLINGRNVITIKGFIQGEPSALANKSIKLGPYNAVTTFNLEYN